MGWVVAAEKRASAAVSSCAEQGFEVRTAAGNTCAEQGFEERAAVYYSLAQAGYISALGPGLSAPGLPVPGS